MVTNDLMSALRTSGCNAIINQYAFLTDDTDLSKDFVSKM